MRTEGGRPVPTLRIKKDNQVSAGSVFGLLSQKKGEGGLGPQRPKIGADIMAPYRHSHPAKFDWNSPSPEKEQKRRTHQEQPPFTAIRSK